MSGRKKSHGEHENSERWLLTYSDMITLLVAFFIMLYAMSVTNKAKFNSMAVSVRAGFGNSTTNMPSILQGMGPGAPRLAPQINKSTPTTDTKTANSAGGTSSHVRDSSALSQQLRKVIEKEKLSSHVEVRVDERGVIVSVLADKYTFESGSADLKSEVKPVLDKIASVIQQSGNIIRVEGHTDNLPISNERFPSNWQLSAVRASNIICYLIAADAVNPDRINSVGYADTHPLFPNDTEEHRAKNRRVEIVFVTTQTTVSPIADKIAEKFSSIGGSKSTQ
jgi:chemotaxis protein MotB